MSTTPLIFDGHNDFLLRLLRDPDNREKTWLTDTGKGHLDLPRMKAGGFGGGFFAIYISSPDLPIDIDDAMENPPYALPLPSLIDAAEAQPIALAMAGHLKWMERASDGQFQICTTVDQLRHCLDNGIIAAIMHIEGAEAIGTDLDALYLFHDMGLRSLGPVWSRPTVFGHGVPFAFPSSPDTGPGLTEAGKDLVRACNELGILLDLSHLNEAGFNDVAKLSRRAAGRHPFQRPRDHAIVAQPDRPPAWHDPRQRRHGRRQFRRQVSERGWPQGMVTAGFDPMLRHLDHLIEHLGEDHVGFGSDFDGAEVPAELGDAAGLVALRKALVAHGYGEALMRKLAHENWLAVLDRTWKADA